MRPGTAVRSAAVALICILPLTTVAPAGRAQAPTPEQLNAIFSAVASPGEPGLAVLIRQNGLTLFERAYGMRDLRSALPVDAHTNFRLASFTKQFTAMAIMLLVHDGKLHYEDHLTDIFPDFPAYGRTITMRNLLNHTSGLIAYEDLMDKMYAGKSWNEIPQITDAGVLALAEHQTATKFPPGTQWEYSNGGYCVLGAIIAKVSGMSYADFLRQRIFAPLKMDDTVAYVYGKDEVANRAYGYTNDAGVWLETDQSPTSATLGDGGVYTSLDDLAKWDDALRNHTLLSTADFQPAVTAQNSDTVLVENPDDPSKSSRKPAPYGFGWFLDPYRGHPRMWHSGSSIGFRTVIERFTENNLTIIILSNRGDLDANALALRAADLYFPLTSYPNSSEGLHDFLNSAVATAKSGDIDKLNALIKSTEIPNCLSTVSAYFPANEGLEDLFNSTYLSNRERSLSSFLTNISQQEGEIAVRSVNNSPQTDSERGRLPDLKQPLDIYFAEWRKAGAASDPETNQVGYFIFIDGGFRWDFLHQFVKPRTGPPPTFMPARRLKMVPPIYPVEAKAKGIQGTVILHVQIQINGIVKILNVVSGDPLLIPAAEKAVVKWRYQPALINGQVVQMDTTLSIIFELDSRSSP